jgi:hypothetical protein
MRLPSLAKPAGSAATAAVDHDTDVANTATFVFYDDGRP